MTHAQFVAGFRAACKAAPKATADSDLSVKPAEKFFSALRALTPPRDTGVSKAAWQAAIDQQLRDLQAFVSFDKKETPKLLRSLKHSNPKPKLPPGTGATAAILAQGFNSKAGREYLRDLGALSKRFAPDQRQFGAIARRAGLAKSVCQGNG